MKFTEKLKPKQIYLRDLNFGELFKLSDYEGSLFMKNNGSVCDSIKWQTNAIDLTNGNLKIFDQDRKVIWVKESEPLKIEIVS